MKIKIGIIGCGPWAEVIKKNLNNNKNFKLKYFVCRNKSVHKKLKDKYLIFNNFNDLIKYEKPNAVYLAGDPSTYLNIIKKTNRHNIDCIIEKPIALNSEDSRKIKRYRDLFKNKIYLNLPNLHDQKFIKLKALILKRKILKIHILEGDNGPFRKKIDPLFDWGTHPISTILYLLNNNNKFEKLSFKKIISNSKLNKKLIKINFVLQNIKIKIITGNALKIKQRKIKFYYNKHDYIIYDFHKKNILSSDYFIKNINEINKRFYPTPMQNLLNNFLKKNMLKNQLKIFDSGIQAIKILNKCMKI